MARKTKSPRTPKGFPELDRSDWQEIYYALESKAKAVEEGHYGPEEEEGADEDWVEHIHSIMEEIARVVDV
jgi:hypothetical protein